MEIANNYKNYGADYTNAAKKADNAKESGSIRESGSARESNSAKESGSIRGSRSTRESKNTRESNITTSTVELKTSAAGITRTEQIKTGFCDVNDYSKYLQEKYRYMNTGTTSMQGIPVTVTVSGAFLKKCMNDPEKAKYLEENLAVIPECVKSLANYTKMMPGSPVCTYAAYIIEEDGTITCMSGCTNDPDGKIARENAERKAQEKKEAEEKAARRRAEQKAKEEKAAKRRAEKKAAKEAGAEKDEYTVSATGKNIKEVTQSILMVVYGTTAVSMTSFDRRA
ncbi:MAG: hypothetical protein NC412_14775 [Roseburia sp.]|nr:hypothetical protein [Roseburia sp.]MCM1279938.1 hypothetical protein [Robinsoniella sp.]